MRHNFVLATAASSLAIGIAALPSAAYAQSTGAVEFETREIIVTAAQQASLAGISIPNTPKSKEVLDQEAIRQQRPGQTVNDIINLVPGVSFQNNDPWGSSGGRFTIRGFGDDRVSQTLDGIPLNDSGNYALYTNQQVDSEVLEQVNVNLGVTDVDSPTASATGGTINIRTRKPADHLALTTTLTYGNVLSPGSGDRPYMRGFGMVDFGDFTGAGTTAFVSASYTRYDNPFNNYGIVDKKQFNGRIYQQIGDNGDFISVSGHYNENRNNFFGSVNLSDLGSGRDRFYEINYPCSIPAATPGVEDYYSDSSSSGDCGSEFDRRYNPSNTGNIRGSSRFTLVDGLILTVDPSFQYVKANGGGPEGLYESTKTIDGVEYTGAFGGRYYYGRDLNGDGDMLDVVAGNDPSHTQTRRYGVIASLAYDINPSHRVRIAYTWDRARHRQTGQTALMRQNGEPADVFPINDPLMTADGYALNKRNRLSYAILHQVSGEYRGRFFDDALTVVLGLRAPFFKRELNQYCYTTSISGYVDCFENQDAAAYEAANPTAVPPTSVTYKYDKLLPNVGFTVNVTDNASVFANYAKGLSVPGTDPLYASLYQIDDTGAKKPAPETTDTFDLGLRWKSGNIQAQLSGWYTKFHNRLASAYDPDALEGNGAVVYRNLGEVEKYGIDASVAWRPTVDTLLYVFGSAYDSEIKEDVLTATGVLETGGKHESAVPTWSLGARGQARFGKLEIGAQVKHTGPRWLNDINTDKVKGYTLVDFDMRYNIAEFPTGGNVAVQLNVTNLFDESYVGKLEGSFDDDDPFVQIGAPRAASISLIVGY